MLFVKLFLICLSLSVCFGKLHTEVFAQPPHCTTLTKDTDFANRFKFDYPVGYIHPTQREVYQKMFCLNPQAVSKAVTTVCDWAAPPQVEFTLNDEYVHVVRVDPSGKYWGDAVIKTYQYCAHNRTSIDIVKSNVTVTEITELDDSELFFM